MHKPNSTCLVLKSEVLQFAYLMDSGISIETLIHLTFHKDFQVLEHLKNGQSLISVFCHNQKALFFKYLSVLATKLNLNTAIECVRQIEESSTVLLEKLVKKIAYPFFLMVFAFFMVVFFSDFVLVQMQAYIQKGFILVWIRILKYLFFLAICIIAFIVFMIYMLFYHFHPRWLKIQIPLIQKICTLQFVSVYKNLDQNSISTQEILEVMSKLEFSIVGFLSKNILSNLEKGISFEKSVNSLNSFDADFKKMVSYALSSNRMRVFFDVYTKKCTFDLNQSIKKISMSIQFFSYISIGFLVLVVYQIMMMPLNMLNQF